MKLSDSARAELEEFFRGHWGDESLGVPAVRVHAGRVAAWLTGRAGIGAITLGRRVLVAPRLVRRVGGRRALPRRLAVHEIAHLLQAQRAGLLPFLFAYLREYLSGMRRASAWDADAHWRAYSEISFEREAREAESAYGTWRARRGQP
jgi:hypothetical protein